MSYVLQFFIAAVATVTFAILFAAPKKELVFCGVSGGLAWLVYFILYRQSGNVVLGSLVATFVLTIFKSYSGSSKMQSCHDLSGIRDFSTGSGSRYLLYGILSDIRNAGKMLGKRAGNF